VFDVTGAGDTVSATLAVALAAGCKWKTARALANLPGGIVVGIVGTAVVAHQEQWQAMAANVAVGSTRE
jgi:D-beta-D-heptose 7-phosphate kinase/D-beta-D-heptose 1-phosphate adenosyltransferase